MFQILGYHSDQVYAGGKSMCNGPCAENWPPLMAADYAKPTADMTIVVRDDGKKMWAYKSKPPTPSKKIRRARRDQRRRIP
jgi:predicted lipoprotein with Yx(FWY)xxD motif